MPFLMYIGTSPPFKGKEPRAIRRRPGVIRRQPVGPSVDDTSGHTLTTTTGHPQTTTTGHPRADDLVEQRTRSTTAGGSNITFWADLVARTIRIGGSDLGMCENTRNLLSTFLSHTSIWNGCLRKMMVHSVWFSIA